VTHPTEQLAPYVDGTLTPHERAEIDTHLATCASCRDEVAASTAVRDALRSMTTPATPTDLGEPAFAEMRGKTEAKGAPGWPRFAPWLAAAAVIGLLAVTLPRIGSSGDDAATTSAEDGVAVPSTPKDLRLEVIAQDFDPDSLEAAAVEFVDAARTEDGGSDTAAPVEGASAAASAAQVTAGKGRSNEALRCLRTAVPELPGRPVRLVKASFQGTPAYLGFVLEGPGAGQPADTVTIWVVSAKDCSVLSLTSAAL
jgi:hypothetical protein